MGPEPVTSTGIVLFNLKKPNPIQLDDFPLGQKSQYNITSPVNIVIINHEKLTDDNNPQEKINQGDIIINKGDTPYDRVADIKFDEKIEDVLPPIMERVKSAVNKK